MRFTSCCPAHSEVVAETITGERRRLETVTRGEWVGELSLINDQPRAASVFALQDSAALRIPSNACRGLIAADPRAQEQLSRGRVSPFTESSFDASPLFAGVDTETLRELDHQLQWIRLPSGEILCREGDEADAVFILVHGSAEVLVGSGEGERLVDILKRGASIGEMAALAGEVRSATVRAVRDSDLIRIPRAEFLRLLDQHATVAVHLAQLLAIRLRQTTRTPRRARPVRAVAVIAATLSGIPPGFSATLSSALEPWNGPGRPIGSKEVDAELGAGAANVAFGGDAGERLSSWLDAQESVFGVVVYECDREASAWTLRALRQADLVLIVGRGEEGPTVGPIDAAIAAGADLSRRRQELVLVHQKSATPQRTARWLERRAPSRHHHLQEGCAADFARLARSISGASVGVALSGGGARGFAHIGLFKALRERNVAVDSVGGTSMGAVIAAEAALGWDIATMIERTRKAFTECAIVGDFTFPYVALMRGASAVEVVRELFGETQIEDLPLPYFCVSTNLTRAEVVVHDRGSLWRWIRASSAVPGIGPPVPWNGDLLVDGGLLNNLPVDILRQRSSGTAIACDVSPAVDLKTKLENCTEMSGWAQLWRRLNPWSRAVVAPNIFKIMMRTVAMSSDQSLERTKKEADLYLHPPLAGIDALDFASIERIVEIGYRHACEQLDVRQKSTIPSPGGPALIQA